MSFVSVEFLAFTAICTAGYYLIPKRAQWVWLLIFSYVYYLAQGPQYIFFILFATAITYLGGLWAESGSKAAVPVTLLLDFGMLAAVKYTNFMIGNLNGLFGTEIREMRLLLPLGISFYTFQATGYLLDVHWKRVRAERNPFRFALFLSFFPQILQGPIGRYGRLADSLYAEKEFDMERILRGLYRIAWGFFMYSAQLYGDFSGGIDVVLGIAEMLGVSLDENFRQPYFAVSITDFWHRWHITLGTWMKDYLFYPISLSRWMGRFGKWCKTHMGKSTGRAMPICVANVIVFLVVGVWHGPAWHNIVYGLYNGLIIGISGLLAKNYREARKRLGIGKDTRWFYIFQILRTFVLVNISWYFDRAGSVGQAFMMMKDSILHFAFSINVVDAGACWSGSQTVTFCAILIGCAVLFVHSVMEERGVSVGEALCRKPLPVRFAVLLLHLY